METDGFTTVVRGTKRQRAENPTTPAPTTAAGTAPAPTKIPPIILHDQAIYTSAMVALRAAAVTVVTARTSGSGMFIQYSAKTSFELPRPLSKAKFHSFQLPTEKSLKVVLRGVPAAPGQEERMRETLTASDYQVQAVTRMRARFSKHPIVLVQLAKSDANKEIFNITEIGELKVKVEAPRAKPSVSQCHRCQRFGHAQSCCRAKPRCVKCTGDHPTSDCTKRKDDGPAQCCNCQGAHPASYQGCPAFPKLHKAGRKNEEPRRDNRPPPKTVTAGLSDANATGAKQVADPSQPAPFPTPTNTFPSDISPNDVALVLQILKALRGN